MAKATGTGQGGKTLNDRLLAANVRTLALRQIKIALEDDSEENHSFRKELLLKLATTVLPRLNEVTGADGGAIEVTGVKISVQ